jgi:hypothetical protein
VIPVTASDLSSLFAPEVAVRLEAARAFAPERSSSITGRLRRGDLTGLTQAVLDPLQDLPEFIRPSVQGWGRHFALCGSANAWLVLVGPSPGNRPDYPSTLHNLLNMAPNSRNPTLGWPHPTLWNAGPFMERIRSWACRTLECAGPIATEEDTLSSTLLVNLTKDETPQESNVNSTEIANGALRFWQIIVPVAKPRLVLALTQAVFDALVAARPPGAATRELGPVVVGTYKPPRVVIQVSPSDDGLVLARAPNHPRRPQPPTDALYAYLCDLAGRARNIDGLGGDSTGEVGQFRQTDERGGETRTVSPARPPRTGTLVKGGDRRPLPGVVTAANLWSVLDAHGITASNRIHCPAHSGVATIDGWPAVDLDEVVRILRGWDFTVTRNASRLTVTAKAR